MAIIVVHLDEEWLTGDLSGWTRSSPFRALSAPGWRTIRGLLYARRLVHALPTLGGFPRWQMFFSHWLQHERGFLVVIKTDTAEGHP